MPQAAEQEYAEIGKTQAIAHHNHDLIHELSKRLDAVWRFDQYIANAEDKPEVCEFWRQLKQEEVRTVDRLKELIADEVRANSF